MAAHHGVLFHAGHGGCCACRGRSLANNNKEGMELGQLQYCTSGTKLLARLIV